MRIGNVLDGRRSTLGVRLCSQKDGRSFHSGTSSPDHAFVIPYWENRLWFCKMLRRCVERLNPYQSLALLAISTSLIEPLKIFAVAIAGAGHWVAGTITVVFAYAVSVMLVERLFEIVKPKLLTLPWFARLWHWFVARRDRALGWLCQALTFGHSFALHDPLGCRVHPNLDFSPIRRPPSTCRSR